MAGIRYLRGDATQPTTPGPKIIAHVVNDQGAWGAGFTKSLSNKWKEAEEGYRSWHHYRSHYIDIQAFNLGNSRDTLVVDKEEIKGPLWVTHMIAQEGLIGRSNPRPLRYDALGSCLLQLAKFARVTQATVHMPRIGCGLAGGDWNIVEPLIYDALGRSGIETYVYELEPWKAPR